MTAQPSRRPVFAFVPLLAVAALAIPGKADAASQAVGIEPTAVETRNAAAARDTAPSAGDERLLSRQQIRAIVASRFAAIGSGDTAIDYLIIVIDSAKHYMRGVTGRGGFATASFGGDSTGRCSETVMVGDARAGVTVGAALSVGDRSPSGPPSSLAGVLPAGWSDPNGRVTLTMQAVPGTLGSRQEHVPESFTGAAHMCLVPTGNDSLDATYRSIESGIAGVMTYQIADATALTFETGDLAPRQIGVIVAMLKPGTKVK